MLLTDRIGSDSKMSLGVSCSDRGAGGASQKDNKRWLLQGRGNILSGQEGCRVQHLCLEQIGRRHQGKVSKNNQTHILHSGELAFAVELIGRLSWMPNFVSPYSDKQECRCPISESVSCSSFWSLIRKAWRTTIPCLSQSEALLVHKMAVMVKLAKMESEQTAHI